MKAVLLAAALTVPVQFAVPDPPAGIVAPPTGKAWCYAKEGYCIVRLDDLEMNQAALEAAGKALARNVKKCAAVTPERRT